MQTIKTSSASTCKPRKLILCAHPDCNRYFVSKGGKKYHSQDCKATMVGTIHAGKIETSKRLQRVAWYLSDNKPHSTREILYDCNVCNVPANELRHPKNGFVIKCEKVGDYYYYTMTGGFSNLLRMVK